MLFRSVLCIGMGMATTVKADRFDDDDLNYVGHSSSLYFYMYPEETEIHLPVRSLTAVHLHQVLVSMITRLTRDHLTVTAAYPPSFFQSAMVYVFLSPYVMVAKSNATNMSLWDRVGQPYFQGKAIVPCDGSEQVSILETSNNHTGKTSRLIPLHLVSPMRAGTYNITVYRRLKDAYKPIQQRLTASKSARIQKVRLECDEVLDSTPRASVMRKRTEEQEKEEEEESIPATPQNPVDPTTLIPASVEM